MNRWVKEAARADDFEFSDAGVDAKVPRIGLISDTHGLLRPQAMAFLQGCDHIIHGGDIGPPEILTQLSALAPLSTVRGNNDRAEWARELPHARLLRFDSVAVYVIHDLAQLELPPQCAVVVSGHSHQPSIRERDGVLYVNPGSAGPRRFKLPIALAELRIEGSSVSVCIVELTAPAVARGLSPPRGHAIGDCALMRENVAVLERTYFDSSASRPRGRTETR